MCVQRIKNYLLKELHTLDIVLRGIKLDLTSSLRSGSQSVGRCLASWQWKDAISGHRPERRIYYCQVPRPMQF